MQLARCMARQCKSDQWAREVNVEITPTGRFCGSLQTIALTQGAGNESCMQLFGLSTCADEAAHKLCNAHVVKQTLETTQILYSLLILWGVVFDGEVDCGEHGMRPSYKLAHKFHPIVSWAKACRAHARWVLAHAMALASEYRVRNNGKVHLCEFHIIHLTRFLQSGGWPLNMPESVSAVEWLDSLPVKQRDGMTLRIATLNPPKGCVFGVIAMDMIGPRRFSYDDWVGSYAELYEWKRLYSFVRTMQFGTFQTAQKRRAREEGLG